MPYLPCLAFPSFSFLFFSHLQAPLQASVFRQRRNPMVFTDFSELLASSVLTSLVSHAKKAKTALRKRVKQRKAEQQKQLQQQRQRRREEEQRHRDSEKERKGKGIEKDKQSKKLSSLAAPVKHVTLGTKLSCVDLYGVYEKTENVLPEEVKRAEEERGAREEEEKKVGIDEKEKDEEEEEEQEKEKEGESLERKSSSADKRTSMDDMDNEKREADEGSADRGSVRGRLHAGKHTVKMGVKGERGKKKGQRNHMRGRDREQQEEEDREGAEAASANTTDDEHDLSISRASGKSDTKSGRGGKGGGKRSGVYSYDESEEEDDEDEEQEQEDGDSDEEECPFTWLDVQGATDQQIAQLADKLCLHHLTVEDCMEEGDFTEKTEVFARYLYVAFTALGEESDSLYEEEQTMRLARLASLMQAGTARVVGGGGESRGRAGRAPGFSAGGEVIIPVPLKLVVYDRFLVSFHSTPVPALTKMQRELDMVRESVREREGRDRG